MNKDIYLRGRVAQRLPILRRKNAAKLPGSAAAPSEEGVELRGLTHS